MPSPSPNIGANLMIRGSGAASPHQDRLSSRSSLSCCKLVGTETERAVREPPLQGPKSKIGGAVGAVRVPPVLCRDVEPVSETAHDRLETSPARPTDLSSVLVTFVPSICRNSLKRPAQRR